MLLLIRSGNKLSPRRHINHFHPASSDKLHEIIQEQSDIFCRVGSLFEHVVTKLGDLIHPNQPIKWQKLDKTLPYLGFDLSLLEKIENIRSIRNNLLHGRELPETQKLRWAAKTLEKVLSNLQERAQGEAKKIIEASIGRFVAGMNDETISRLWTLRQRGVQLRNQLITPEEFPVWSAEFEKWHSELLTEAERESANLRKWLEPLDKLRKWDVTRWVNNEHRLKLNIISETLDRLAKYLTTNL